MADRDLVAAFVRRMQAAEEIAVMKQASGIPLRDKDRENVVLARVGELAGPHYAEDAQRLYKSILSVSRTRQRELLDERRRVGRDPIAFPEAGIIASLEEGLDTCQRLFEAPQIVLCASTEAVCRAVAAGRSAFGLLPVACAPILPEKELYIVRRTSKYLCVAAQMFVYEGWNRIGLLSDTGNGRIFTEMDVTPDLRYAEFIPEPGIQIIGRYAQV